MELIAIISLREEIQARGRKPASTSITTANRDASPCHGIAGVTATAARFCPGTTQHPHAERHPSEGRQPLTAAAFEGFPP